eukprot:1325427-Amphidinium_carterae.1
MFVAREASLLTLRPKVLLDSCDLGLMDEAKELSDWKDVEAGSTKSGRERGQQMILLLVHRI